MKRSLNRLTNYIIETKDGKEAEIIDFLFDEKQWIIRYLEADFGHLFSSKKILIPKVLLKQPFVKKDIFPAELASDDIEKCPKRDDHLPVSREYEEKLNEHYRLNPYWISPYLGLSGVYYPPRSFNIPEDGFSEKDVDAILRSFKEVVGYHIQAIDGNLGHIEDVIVDDTDWQIVYVVIDTKNWLPWSKKVLIAVDLMKSISYEKREVVINLKTDVIKNAPEYHAIEHINTEYEKSLFDYYSSSLVK